MSKIDYIKSIILESLEKSNEVDNSITKAKHVDYIFSHLHADFQNKINGNSNYETIELLKSSNFVLLIADRRLKVNKFFYTKKFFEFFIYVMKILTSTLTPKSVERSNKITILYGISWNQIKNPQHSLQNLENFLIHFSRKNHLKMGDNIILISNTNFPKISKSSTVIVDKFASLAFYKMLTISQKMKVLKNNGKGITYSFLKFINGSSRNLVRINEIDNQILIEVSRMLKVKLNIIATQSVLLSPPSIFYSQDRLIISKIGIWYSDNNIAVPNNRQKDSDFSYDFFRVDLLNRIFVWSEVYKNILAPYTKATISAVGPILVNQGLIEKDKKKQRQNVFTISFFGISPTFGLPNGHFYSLKNSIEDLKIISQIIDILDPAKSNFKIKLKRSYNKFHHEKDYYLIADKLKDYSNVEIIVGEEKAFDIISESGIVICTPFTSAALIAKSMGVEAVFFTGQADYKLPKKYEQIDIIIGQEQLLKRIVNRRMLDF